MLRRAWYRVVGFVGTSLFLRTFHHRVYRLTGGRGLVGRSLGNLTVVLVTTGARTGLRREVALWAYRDADDLVLVASNGGRHPVPGWCLNLRAHPDALVEVGRESRAVHAHEASGDEYERLWVLVIRAYPGYLDYARRVGRHIPLVVLEPAPAAPAGG